MTRQEIIDYLIEVTGDRQHIERVSKGMNDIQLHRMFNVIQQQQDNELMELQFV
ncbi:hypothetical protein [Enterococcus larvae]|uniref:hypothetical protein n=1 Tax=Enterococcus larvae TaxID=2794352 RepID=UPI003F31219F